MMSFIDDFTAFYAGILGIMLLLLSACVIKERLRTGTTIMTGEDKALTYAVRAQGNFTEYAPIFLILILCCESLDMPIWAIFLLGNIFVLGRILHAISLIIVESKNPANIAFRKAGMVMTITSLIVLSATALFLTITP